MGSKSETLPEFGGEVVDLGLKCETPVLENRVLAPHFRDCELQAANADFEFHGLREFWSGGSRQAK